MSNFKRLMVDFFSWGRNILKRISYFFMVAMINILFFLFNVFWLTRLFAHYMSVKTRRIIVSSCKIHPVVTL